MSAYTCSKSKLFTPRNNSFASNKNHVAAGCDIHSAAFSPPLNGLTNAIRLRRSDKVMNTCDAEFSVPEINHHPLAFFFFFVEVEKSAQARRPDLGSASFASSMDGSSSGEDE